MGTKDQFMSDYRIIMKAYREAVAGAKGQKRACTRDVPFLVKEAKRYMDVLKAQKDHTGYRNTVRAGKMQARIFAEWVARTPEKIKEEAYETMNELLSLAGEYETANVQRLREKLPLGERLNLKKILEETNDVSQILSMEVDRIVERTLNGPYSVVFCRKAEPYYATASGKHYHKENCPYCKGKEIYPVTRGMIENLGCQPCVCVTGVKARKLSPERLDRKAVTIFVDESIRKNPFSEYDPSLPECEGVYSYVVCRGRLKSEKEITEKNLIRECAAFADECTGDWNVTNITIEGIYKALCWTAYRYGFRGEVNLFVDNLGVIGHLRKTEELRSMEALFEKVTLTHVPRTENKRADMVGRKEALFHANPKVIEEMMKTEAIVDVIYEARREGAVTRLEDILKKKHPALIASYNGTVAGGGNGC